MNEKKNVIYDSSQQDFWKLFILALTFGISVFASLFDTQSCYVTILVQACNNIYDFSFCVDNLKYTKMIRRESIFVIICSLISVIISIIALLGTYVITKCILAKLFGIFLVAMPLAVIYNDYKMNIEIEDLT